MTFSFDVQTPTATILSRNITLASPVTFISGGTNYTCDEIFYDDVNSNIDSSEFVARYSCVRATINEICEESDRTFLEAAGLAGMLLTIVLIGGALSIMFLSFSGMLNLNLNNFKPGNLTLQEVIGGILIVGLTFLVIATMAFLIGGEYCPVISG